jgi:hypothetical protein
MQQVQRRSNSSKTTIAKREYQAIELAEHTHFEDNRKDGGRYL